MAGRLQDDIIKGLEAGVVREGFSGEVTFELKLPTMGRLGIEHSRWKGRQMQINLACLRPLC